MAEKEDMKDEEVDTTEEEEESINADSDAEPDEESSDEIAEDASEDSEVASEDASADADDEEASAEEDASADGEEEPSDEEEDPSDDEEDASDEENTSDDPEEEVVLDDEDEVAADGGVAEGEANVAEADDDDAEADIASTEEDVASADIASTKQVRGVAAFFEHPKHLLAAASHARDSRYEEFEAYSPFPIHGMDDAMGLGRSWIPWVTFGAGCTGFLLANMLQFGMMTFDWPMIIGGKPFAPWPSFVPIMFELTVLLAGVTTAVVMLAAAGCFRKSDVIDPRITDDRFVLWISAEDDEFDVEEVRDFLQDLRPLEVRTIAKDA